jgi:hypothetical protein
MQFLDRFDTPIKVGHNSIITFKNSSKSIIHNQDLSVLNSNLISNDPAMFNSKKTPSNCSISCMY